MTDNPIILNNSGDDQYKMLSREWISNPVLCKHLKIMLADASQLAQAIEIKSHTSTGAEDNRTITLAKYINSSDKSNLIVDVPLIPELLLDGSTYFRIKIPALSQVILVFSYEQGKVTL
jgi:hypothetical protein